MSDKVKTPWGEIGYITYKRTYARRLKEGDLNSPTEEFEDTVDRVVKGSVKQLKVPFNENEQERLKEIMMSLKGTVAGRFFWQLGTKTVDQLGMPSLQNCAACVVDHPIRPFTWAFDMLMLGSGVGYNIQREFVYKLPKVVRKKVRIERKDTNDADFIVPDSREGWGKLLGKVLKAHFYNGEGFTYSTKCIRGKGSPIRGFGGTASGPEDLVVGIDNICKVFQSRRGKQLRPIDCLDIMNIIGSIVVAGNVRRSAQIAIGDYDDLEFLSAKNWSTGKIPNWRAMSNNSVVCNDISKLPDQFWEGYLGNGEPYGLINLKLSQSCGRTGETQYPDPEVLIYNPCFTGDTPLLTADGYRTFSELKDKEVDLVNYKGEIHKGTVWSNGVKDIVSVKNSIGEIVKCTSDHRFMTNDGEECKAQSLKGKRLMPLLDIRTENDYYTKLGFIQGDGGTGRLSSERHLGLELNIGAKDQEVALLFGVDYKEGKRAYYVNGFNDELKKLGFDSRNLPERELPSTFEDWEEEEQLSFLRGIYSANGSVISGKRVSFKTTCRELSRQLVDVLNEYQIRSYITTNKSKPVEFDNGTYTCKESYDVNITQYNSVKRFAKLIGFVHEYKNESLKDLLVKNSPVITSVKEAGREEVFDFNLQDDTHWGVVGEGYVAHNCAEQSLAPYETCCLAEVHLPNIDSLEELQEVATYLYRINKHSLAIKCHNKETESIVHKNMRMGIGVTGYAMATKKQKSWLPKVYEYLREYDKEYSAYHGFPESIKLTTVKPSGTLSLLSGVTPGAHPGYDHYFIRRVRMASNIPLVDKCKAAGYKVEFARNFDGSEDKGTVVVEFPCKFPKHTTVAKDVSAIDQLETVKELQSKWSDNAVSVTVYYRKEELEDIKKWLGKNYNENTKTVSFLLHSDHGFDQAPYESITKEEYDRLSKKCTPITEVEIDEDSVDELGECGGGACPIK